MRSSRTLKRGTVPRKVKQDQLAFAGQIQASYIELSQFMQQFVEGQANYAVRLPEDCLYL
ncbi:MAG: hypothetical protein DMG78_31515 [Acidobacteria bacterium]|nr:MAG: hypothetical protein DMG78_31515 [Acidobacteriota bacterium]